MVVDWTVSVSDMVQVGMIITGGIVVAFKIWGDLTIIKREMELLWKSHGENKEKIDKIYTHLLENNR